MEIYNRRDLRIAYEQILFLKQLKDEYGDDLRIRKHLKRLKQDIRKYNNRVEEIPRWLVKDDGMDGYVELIEMPETEDPEGWFDDNARLTYMPSMYDCTGQAFTFSHKIFRRRGKLMCYHTVCFDL